MSLLILTRHGQSTWNLEKKFTGWVDVDLTDQGKLEAKKAGELIKKNNILQLFFKYLLKILCLEYFLLELHYKFQYLKDGKDYFYSIHQALNPKTS